MTKASPDPLAREITRKESQQSYRIISLLVDRDLVEDAYRAYAYFRWVDDLVDKPSISSAERVAFVRRQRALIEQLYLGIKVNFLRPEERMVVNLVRNDRGPNSLLRSYIENFLSVIEFDAHRKGQRIAGTELEQYSDQLALAVTDAILYFIKNDHQYPEDRYRTSAARAAHITHMLRDMRQDMILGYWNIPSEYLYDHRIWPEDIGTEAFLSWVRARVREAREGFRVGKAYIDDLEVLRTKIAARWYCARFEPVLDIIEKDGYHLRLEYSDGQNMFVMSRMIWIAVSVSLHHMVSKLQEALHHNRAKSKLAKLSTTMPTSEPIIVRSNTAQFTPASISTVDSVDETMAKEVFA